LGEQRKVSIKKDFEKFGNGYPLKTRKGFRGSAIREYPAALPCRSGF
jgi:hypothetical protein